VKTKEKKVLITTSTYPRWRSDNTPAFVKQLAQSVNRKGMKVSILAPHYKRAKRNEVMSGVDVKRYRYAFPARQQNITYDGGGVYKISKSFSYIVKLVCLVASLTFNTFWLSIKNRVDVINPHWIVPQGFAAVIVKFFTRKRVVLTVHGSDVFSLTGKTMTKIKRFVLKNSDEVCVNSKATESACISIYKREYTVIPMGVDFEIFKPVKRSTQLANRYKLSEFTILFVGRLVEVKGVEYLIEALSKLSKDEIHFKALIVGDGPLKPEIESYVANNDLNSKVEFCGWVDKSKLEEYYSVADVFVGPSLQEAQGIVFVEALATGTPVVASRVGGIIDIVTEGKNGYLVPAKSSRLLYEKLKLIIDDKDLLKKLSKSSRQEAKKKFSWDVVSEKYIKILSGGNKL